GRDAFMMRLPSLSQGRALRVVPGVRETRARKSGYVGQKPRSGLSPSRGPSAPRSGQPEEYRAASPRATRDIGPRRVDVRMYGDRRDADTIHRVALRERPDVSG